MFFSAFKKEMEGERKSDRRLLTPSVSIIYVVSRLVNSQLYAITHFTHVSYNNDKSTAVHEWLPFLLWQNKLLCHFRLFYNLVIMSKNLSDRNGSTTKS